jgi:serine/threonine protein kinase
VDAIAPGAVLLGKYRVDELIGVGGMGKVVRASHLYLQQPVAIKVLLPEMAHSTSTVARFLREAQATVQLKSEHIARVIDVGTLPDGTPLMVMEYLTGNDLNQILRHHGPQAPAIVCDLMLQACEGIAEAHAFGIVHRDIKPSNFFITQRPDGSMLLKILDFGISKTPVGLSELTGTQAVLGTPTYMAPEQMKSGRDADARSDIWSMGVVMYQLLAGRPPFNGESYAALVLQVNGEPPSPLMVPLPAGLGEVIFRCLEKDPSNRHQNVGELARMVAPYATDPIAAALSAARTTRILQNKNSAPNALPLTAGGGLATPMPLSPAQLTPRTWPPPQSQTSISSISQGAGQLTYQTRSSRSWIIGGAAAVVLMAGAGGYVVNELTKNRAPARRDEPYVQAPVSAQAPTPTPAPPPSTPPSTDPQASATPPAPPPTTTLPAPPTTTFEKNPAGTEKKPETPGTPGTSEKPAVSEKKPATSEKPATKPVTKPESKPATTKPESKPTTTKPTKPKSDDLFDNRH